MTQDDIQLQKKILNILQNMIIDFSHSKIINTNSVNFRELLDLLKIDKEELLQIIQDNVSHFVKPIKQKPSHATVEEMGADEQLRKYLKYKAKYLNLKKNL
jgi:arsenate reductase-like glutaredoxin family protein